MRSFVMIALLAAPAIGCGAKKSGADCDGSIGKSMDKLAEKVKARSDNPQQRELMGNVISKMKTTLVKRCSEDKWPNDAVACFATVSSQPEIRACETKLNPDQQAKLRVDLRQLRMGAGGPPGGMRMPAGLEGHPQTLQGVGAGSGLGEPAVGSAAGSGTAPAGSAAPSPPTGSAEAPASGW